MIQNPVNDLWKHPIVRVYDSLPVLPGGMDNYRQRLIMVLQHTRTGLDLDGMIQWNSGESSPARSVAYAVAPSGMIETRGNTAVLTEYGAHWLENSDDTLLICILASHNRYLGWCLKLLAGSTQSMSLPELDQAVREHYSSEWKSLGITRAVIAWLRVTGMVEYFEGLIKSTDRGVEVAQYIPAHRPRQFEIQEADVSVSPEIISALAEIDLSDRSRNAYLLTGQSGMLHSLFQLLLGSREGVSIARFHQLCESTSESGVKESTSRHVLDGMSKAGLLVRVGRDKWVITEPASLFLESESQFDVAYIVVMNVQYLLEMLFLLSESSSLSASEMAEASDQYLDDRIHRHGMNMRLSMLKSFELIDHLTQSRYIITEAGRQFLRYFNKPSPRIDFNEVATTPADDSNDFGDDDPLAEIQTLLQSSNHNSPTAFSTAVIEALTYLGFETNPFDEESPGKAIFGVGDDEVIASVETEVSNQNRISLSSANFVTLEKRRSRLRAAITLLVGHEFDSDTIAAAEKDESVALVPTGLISTLIARAQPVSNEEISLLTDTLLSPIERELNIASVWKKKDSQQECIEKAISILLDWRKQQDPSGWMEVKFLYFSLRQQAVSISEDSFSELVDFLSHPWIGIAETRSDKKSTVGEIRISCRDGFIIQRLNPIHQVIASRNTLSTVSDGI